MGKYLDTTAQLETTAPFPGTHTKDPWNPLAALT